MSVIVVVSVSGDRAEFERVKDIIAGCHQHTNDI